MGKRREQRSSGARSAALAAAAAKSATSTAATVPPTSNGSNGSNGSGSRRDQRDRGGDGYDYADPPPQKQTQTPSQSSLKKPNASNNFRKRLRVAMKLVAVFAAGRIGRTVFVAVGSGSSGGGDGRRMMLDAISGGGAASRAIGEAMAGILGSVDDIWRSSGGGSNSPRPTPPDATRVRAPTASGEGERDYIDGERVPLPPIVGTERPSSIVGGYYDGEVPPTLSPFGSYPNWLNITDETRKSFHPVVIFPRRKPACGKKRWLGWRGGATGCRMNETYEYTVPGRYDDIAGPFVRVGVDLGGPTGTKVRAFADGVVFWAGPRPVIGGGDGRNADCNASGGIGDRAIVIAHALPGGRKVWAMYAGLDNRSVAALEAAWDKANLKSKRRRVKRGEVLGRIIAVGGNGCNRESGVRFQLSVEEPTLTTNDEGTVVVDMPDVVPTKDRSNALRLYPDPRIVLGELY